MLCLGLIRSDYILPHGLGWAWMLFHEKVLQSNTPYPIAETYQDYYLMQGVNSTLQMQIGVRAPSDTFGLHLSVIALFSPPKGPRWGGEHSTVFKWNKHSICTCKLKCPFFTIQILHIRMNRIQPCRFTHPRLSLAAQSCSLSELIFINAWLSLAS